MARRTRKSRAAAAAPSPRPGLPATPRWVAAGLGALILAAYANAIGLGLAVDAPYLLQNPRLAAVTWANLQLIFTKPYWWPSHTDDLYRPLTTLTLLFDPGGQAHPWTLHLGNVLLHALNVWLAFRLAFRVMGGPIAAAAVAALFAVHPIGTDTVTNIAGRADLLAVATLLGGVLAHARSVEEPDRSGRWRLLLLVLAVAGVFCKENAAVLLPLLVLYDVALGSRGAAFGAALRQAWARGRASYAAAAAALLVMAVVRHVVMSDELPHWQPFGDNPLTVAPFVAARLTAVGVLGRGLLLLVWPSRLSADYSYDQIPVIGAGAPLASHLGWMATAAVLGALMIIAWRMRAARPPLFFWVFFGLGTLLPTANLLVLIGSIMAERFWYLPAMGFCGIVVTAGAWVVERRSARPGVDAGRLRQLAAGVAAVVLLALAARTAWRNRDWRNDEALWRSAIRVVPGSSKPYKGLARTVHAQGRLDEAIALMESSLSVFDAKPVAPVDYSSDLLQGLGEFYTEKGDVVREAGKEGEARTFYEKAAAILERAFVTDQATNARVRELRLARGEADADIQDVGVLKIYEALGTAALRLGRLDRARTAFEWQRHINPTRADAYLDLAAVASLGGRPSDEAALLVEALIVEPDRAEVWAALNPVAAREGIRGLAAERTRVRVDPSDPALAALVGRACPDLLQVMRAAKRERAAVDAQAICTKRLGWRPPGRDSQ
jgi:tetratricopeptide (TPR) repeat protein